MQIWVRSYFVLVVANCSLGNRAHVALARLQHIRVVWWQHGCRSANNRTKAVVHLLGARFLDGVFERRTLGCGALVGRDRWVRVQVVVVVGLCAYNGALHVGVSMWAISLEQIL